MKVYLFSLAENYNFLPIMLDATQIRHGMNGPLFLPTTGWHPYSLLACKFSTKTLLSLTLKYPSLCPSLAENYEFLPIILATTQIRDERPIIPSYHGLTPLFLTSMQISTKTLLPLTLKYPQLCCKAFVANCTAIRSEIFQIFFTNFIIS